MAPEIILLGSESWCSYFLSVGGASVPQFPHLYDTAIQNNTFLPGLSGGLNRLSHVKHFQQFWAGGKLSVNVRSCHHPQAHRRPQAHSRLQDSFHIHRVERAGPAPKSGWLRSSGAEPVGEASTLTNSHAIRTIGGPRVASLGRPWAVQCIPQIWLPLQSLLGGPSLPPP